MWEMKCLSLSWPTCLLVVPATPAAGAGPGAGAPGGAGGGAGGAGAAPLMVTLARSSDELVRTSDELEGLVEPCTRRRTCAITQLSGRNCDC